MSVCLGELRASWERAGTLMRPRVWLDPLLSGEQGRDNSKQVLLAVFQVFPWPTACELALELSVASQSNCKNHFPESLVRHG